jgi:hypothetical protein
MCHYLLVLSLKSKAICYDNKAASALCLGISLNSDASYLVSIASHQFWPSPLIIRALIVFSVASKHLFLICATITSLTYDINLE